MAAYASLSTVTSEAETRLARAKAQSKQSSRVRSMPSGAVRVSKWVASASWQYWHFLGIGITFLFVDITTLSDPAYPVNA